MAEGLGFTSSSDMINFNAGEYSTATGLTSTKNQNSAQDSRAGDRDVLQIDQTQRRRKRTTFSKTQLSLLEAAFSIKQYPDTTMKETLSFTTGLQGSTIQMWFQNRRTRFFKSVKESRKDAGESTDHLPGFPHIVPPSSPFHQPAPSLPPTPSCSPPAYITPNLPQSTRLSNIMDGRANLPPALLHQSPSYSLQCLPGVPQHPLCYQTQDFTQYSLIGFPNNVLTDLDLPDDFEAVLSDTQGPKAPESSRCGAEEHLAATDSLQRQADHTQGLNHTNHFQYPISEEDPTQLCLQDLLDDFSWPNEDFLPHTNDLLDLLKQIDL